MMAVTQSSSSGVAARRRLAIIAAHAVEGGGGSSARPSTSTSTWRPPRPPVGLNTADAVGAAAAEAEPMAEMSDREKFLIDLHGYLVVPNVLSPHEVAELNAATDACWDSEYTDGAGEVHPCRQRGHQSVAFDEMRGMLEWAKPHCVPFRNLLTHPKLVPYMNSLHGRGWRMDHAPFLIAGSGSLGGHIHGHPWDPEYRYRYSNGVMRSGHLAIAFQLREVRKDWGGFGIIPGSHKVNYPLPAELRSTSLTSIIPPLVSPAAPMGSLLIFFESALHTSLPWYGPPGTERRSLLFRIAPMHSSHRSGLGTHWGGSWTYEAKQPQWVEDELTPEQQEVLSAPRGNLASTFPTAPEGTSISGGALIRDEPEPETEPEPEQEEEGEEAVSTQQLDYRYISGRHGYRPRG